MYTTKWSIGQLERNTSDNGVVIAHWNCTGTDGEYTARNYGTVNFTPDPTKTDFIPFDDLTEEIVVGWVKDSMQSTLTIPAELDEDGNIVTPASIEAVDGTADIEANLAKQIELQKNPTKASGVPWNEPVTEA